MPTIHCFETFTNGVYTNIMKMQKNPILHVYFLMQSYFLYVSELWKNIDI